MIQTVGVIGAGTIGASWASFFASRGLTVRLIDNNPACLERGAATAGEILAALETIGLLDADARRAAAGRLSCTMDWDAFAAGTDYFQEAVLETYEAKEAVLEALEARIDPATLIASSSSGLLASRMQSTMRDPGRFLIAHPFNPPHLMPLIELVPGERTDPRTLEQAHGFFTALGKVPVRLKKETPGHIANRLAAALWREAIDLVAQGVADVEEVDRALVAGPGLRWALMGQHLIYHLGGGAGGYGYFMDHIGKAFEQYWDTMADWTAIPAEARAKVLGQMEDYLAGRSAAELSLLRDKKLAAVLRALYPPASTTE